MALRFCDSFDHYTWSGGNPPTGDLLEKWTSWSASGGGTVTFASPVSGRNGNGAQLSGSNIEVEMWKQIDSQSTWIIGWAFRMANTDDTGVTLFRLRDGGSDQVIITANPTNGNFNLYRGNGATFLVSSTTGLISPAQWMYLEVKWIGSQTTGTFELRRNGEVIATYTGDTCATANTTANTIYFGGDRTQTGTTTIDDVYMCDGTDSGVSGAPNNDYLGDVRIEVLYPNGNGNSSQFIGSDSNSTDNYLLVDETTPNGDTDYVKSAAVGDKDTYNMSSLVTATGTVYGIQLAPNARKDDAGTRAFKSVVRYSGVETDGAEHFLGTSYLMYPEAPLDGDPSGNQWTISSINAMEAGAKVST